MDQDSLLRLQLASHKQSVDHCAAHDGHRGCFFKRPVIGHRQLELPACFTHTHTRGESLEGKQAHDSVAVAVDARVLQSQ